MKSATGLEVKERVPDRVIREADAVVNVDLPGPELRDRLKQGKVYPPAQAAQPRSRTSSGRRTSAPCASSPCARPPRTSITARPRRAAALFRRVAPAIRVAVALPLDPVVARALIRRGSRMAGRMNTRWYALYVRRKRDRPENLSA